jgi:hypothetical protein
VRRAFPRAGSASLGTMTAKSGPRSIWPRWHAQVRRVLHPRNSQMDQCDGPEGRSGQRGLEAQAGARGGDGRLRQPTARAHPYWSTTSSTSCG